MDKPTSEQAADLFDKMTQTISSNGGCVVIGGKVLSPAEYAAQQAGPPMDKPTLPDELVTETFLAAVAYASEQDELPGRTYVPWDLRDAFIAGAAWHAALKPEWEREDIDGGIVVTKNDQGQIVAVTCQDEEGRILSVIAESDSPQQAPEDRAALAEDAMLLAIDYAGYYMAFYGDPNNGISYDDVRTRKAKLRAAIDRLAATPAQGNQLEDMRDMVPAPMAALAREAKNQVCIQGHLTTAFNKVLRSNEPDAIDAYLVTLAHAAVDIAVKLCTATPVVPDARAEEQIAELWKVLRTARWALQAPLDDWKGSVERLALDAISALIAKAEPGSST